LRPDFHAYLILQTQELLGYVASALIGIALGLIGGGGSILTVPVLVYLFHIEPTLATAYSLFIVGTTALAGGIRSAANKMVDFRTAIVFSIPSFVAVYLTRGYLMPAIPDEIGTIGTFMITRNIAIMLFFAIIMLAAAFSMIRDKHQDQAESTLRHNYPLLVLEGIIVGILTGMVGAGGGFLIIPALVLFAKLPMKKAVGTSLVIIAVKSLIGFLGDVGTGQAIDYSFLFTLSAIAIAGIFLGIYLSRFTSGTKLKKAFGWFVLIMAIYIILRESVF
jgi:uncharacterized membrane protein YfcA